MVTVSHCFANEYRYFVVWPVQQRCCCWLMLCICIWPKKKKQAASFRSSSLFCLLIFEAMDVLCAWMCVWCCSGGWVITEWISVQSAHNMLQMIHKQWNRQCENGLLDEYLPVVILLLLQFTLRILSFSIKKSWISAKTKKKKTTKEKPIFPLSNKQNKK